jgi:hypothetical protein
MSDYTICHTKGSEYRVQVVNEDGILYNKKECQMK